MRVIITAGPTREHIDDIRFITNASSGLMGVALANEAAFRGHDVTLVLGPTPIAPAYGMKIIPVVSADEMTEKTLRELSSGYDMLISAAAIGDFAPVGRFRGKLSSQKGTTVTLKPTRKLVKEARKAFPRLRIVAFKAEYAKSEADLLSAGRRLLPFAEMVVANDVSREVFGSDDTQAYIVRMDAVEMLPRMPKKAAAKRIFDALE